MSDVIKLLPDSVANQIAAGEVIQRPASVVKELVENSIDAGATAVQIILKDAGKTLIQVIDNGVGMTDTDARLAFERHSTSKIRKADDLFALRTMGFRGEALASIAAISQLELRTCARGAELGTHLTISASKCESQEPDVCPEGSNFMIKNIFFNVPARRKFLKSNAVELSNIIKEFERLALVNPSVEFTLISNGSKMYELLGGNFKQRIMAVFGNSLDTQLLPISVDTTLAKITGFVSRPENARKRNFLQYLFVNGRYMRHPYFHKAILSSYEQLIPADSQPCYFLNFTVAPDTIDVNIHPTKTEIKFENEVPVWQILAAAVKETLGKFNLSPTIDFDTADAPDIPVYRGGGGAGIPTPEIDLDPAYNPFDSIDKPVSGHNRDWRQKQQPSMDWEKLYSNFEKAKGQSVLQQPQDGTAPSHDPTETPAGALIEDTGSGQTVQLRGKYILTTIKSGIMLVDQHRAHVRVLYDRYISQMDSDNIVSQRVLFPEVLSLSVAQELVLEELHTEIEKIGFNLSNLGGNDWSINGIPAAVENVDASGLLLEVIDAAMAGGSLAHDRVKESIAAAVAERAAVPYGRTLSQEEADKLLADLLKLPQPNYTPSGKTIICAITHEQIAKMFD